MRRRMSVFKNFAELRRIQSLTCKRTYWADYSYRSAQLLIWMAFIVGALPLTFKIEAKNKMQFVESKFHYWRWRITVWWALTLFVANGLRLCYDVFNGDLSSDSMHDVIRIFAVAGSLLMAVLHAHTLWRIQNLVGFINLCVAYYEGFQGIQLEKGKSGRSTHTSQRPFFLFLQINLEKGPLRGFHLRMLYPDSLKLHAGPGPLHFPLWSPCSTLWSVLSTFYTLSCPSVPILSMRKSIGALEFWLSFNFCTRQ